MKYFKSLTKPSVRLVKSEKKLLELRNFNDDNTLIVLDAVDSLKPCADESKVYGLYSDNTLI